ncbi:uncharacterized protein [Nicotiana tomentosiformis]|uniref:uncharacterized protein n=1 Tax=Nicotiana tomentosiformis TaxID=4098 RepID=UPI00051B9360|nr:uncharacterized protein LOC104116854 [Nicotiana tomentosiformis]
MPHVSANSQYSFVEHGQSFSFQNLCAKVVLPLFPNMNQHTQDTNFCCNISFAALDASDDMEYARQLLDQLSVRVMIGETWVLNRHLPWLQPAFGFPSCTWFGTGQKDLARLLCAGQRLIGAVDQSILVGEQSGLVELIDFTHLHGTNVQLHDVAILYWLAYSRQVVTVQHVHAFHDKLVKSCRDNEQVFEVEYIDASWIDIPLGAVKVYFHHALSYTYFNLGDVLNDKVLYSRKVILFSSCIFESVNSATKMVLRGKADNHVSEELIFLMQNSSHHVDTPRSSNKFLTLIGDLSNCSFKNYILHVHVFFGLMKEWFLELQEHLEKYLHARFAFGINLLGSRNQIYCNWCTTFNQIINEFVSCISCRYRDIRFDDSKMFRTDMSCLPETSVELEVLDFFESCVQIRKITIPYMPSFLYCQNLKIFYLSIHMSVIDNTTLQSPLWIILGASYIISLDLSLLDHTDKPELSAKLFHVLSGVLHFLDQSFVCSSNQFPSMAFNFLVVVYLVKLRFLLELGALTAGIDCPLLLLLPFLFILQGFEAYVGVMLLQTTLIGFSNAGHILALILEETREIYLVIVRSSLYCGKRVANDVWRLPSSNVFNFPNRTPGFIIHNQGTKQEIIMILTYFGISFATILKSQTSTFVGCKILDLNIEDKVLFEGGRIVTNGINHNEVLGHGNELRTGQNVKHPNKRLLDYNWDPS